MRLLNIFTVASFAAVCTGAGSSQKVIHEERDENDDDWRKVSKADAAHVLPVRIALTQRNLEHAERYIMDVSDPASPNFGKHWSAEKVAYTFAPTEETYGKVTQWLEESGVERSRIRPSAGLHWVMLNATVNEVEQLLDTKYHVFKHEYHGEERVGCDSYKLPMDLRKHVDFVTPTVSLNGLERLNHRMVGESDQLRDIQADEGVKLEARAFPNGLSGLKHCGQLVTIDCLRALYGFPKGKTSHKGNRMGIGEWHDYLYRPDLRKFFDRFTNPKIPTDTFPEFVSIDGGKHSNLTVAKQGIVIESGEDFQISYSIIYPQNMRLYQVGDGINVSPVGTFNIFLDALDASYCTYKGGDSAKHDPHYPDPHKGGYKGPVQCGGAPRSNVISISYGQVEAALPRFYQHRQCHEYMKLGLMGVSVLFASGDSGVARSPTSGVPAKCLDENSTKRSVNGTRFSPGFPNNCPYVTAVGATDLLHKTPSDKAIFRGERAVSQADRAHPENSFYSGGGFSNYFAMPSFQAKAVTNYLAKYPPGYGSARFNNSGNARAYPDVSALGLNIAVVYLNNTIGGGGTSASSPIVASIVNLLNEERINAGKGPLGFLNPTFYANPDAFNDITVGDNPGCGTRGFACQPGWDPVTGLGTPNYPKLLKVFMDLP